MLRQPLLIPAVLRSSSYTSAAKPSRYRRSRLRRRPAEHEDQARSATRPLFELPCSRWRQTQRRDVFPRADQKGRASLERSVRGRNVPPHGQKVTCRLRSVQRRSQIRGLCSWTHLPTPRSTQSFHARRPSGPRLRAGRRRRCPSSRLTGAGHPEFGSASRLERLARGSRRRPLMRVDKGPINLQGQPAQTRPQTRARCSRTAAIATAKHFIQIVGHRICATKPSRGPIEEHSFSAVPRAQ